MLGGEPQRQDELFAASNRGDLAAVEAALRKLNGRTVRSGWVLHPKDLFARGY